MKQQCFSGTYFDQNDVINMILMRNVSKVIRCFTRRRTYVCTVCTSLKSDTVPRVVTQYTASPRKIVEVDQE